MKMNKIFKLLQALLTIVLVLSCNDQLTEDHDSSRRKITVRSEVGNKVKGGYEGTTTLPSEFIMDIIQGDNEKYDYSLIKMVKDEVGTLYNAPENMALLWVDSDHSAAHIKAMTVPYGMEGIDPENPMEISVCTDQRTDEKIEVSDVLYAETGNGIKIEGDDIRIVFNHMMSKLLVTYKIEKESVKNIVVKSLSLENICIKGGFSYSEINYNNDISLGYGNIDMYHEEGKAEALFYPYIPEEDPVLAVKMTIDGLEKEFRCPVSLKDNNGFQGGKRYKMNIMISGSTISNASVTMVKEWDTDEDSIVTDDCEKVLWVGTSIPAGIEDNNYPEMVADALGFKLYNNARGSSFACFYSDEEDGTNNWKTASSWEDYSNQVWKGYSLSATIEEIETKFNRNDYPESILPEWLLESFRNHSYERLIIPYIDGTLASCTNVIIDHGYNDRHAILNESSWHNGEGEEQFKIGSGWDWLYNLRDTRNMESETFFQGEWWNQEGRKNSYFGAMIYLVREILEINPRINIIFGNYFAWKSPVFGAEYGNDNYCNFLCAANESLASMFKRPLVNVYEYTGIRNININGISDYYTFCPDGVHPHSDETGESNRKIAEAYIRELNGIIN